MVAHDLGVDEKRICEWRSLASCLEEMTNASVKNSSKRFRLQGGGRKPLLQDIEQTVADWVVQQRMAYHRVTQHGIAMKAIKCHDGNLVYNSDEDNSDAADKSETSDTEIDI